ncbi:MIP/aquaporin family protein [Streptomyces sp. NPDC090106]|uniref:MIP/aquaporin family protein n=1 Tax=Streptomyces sp. NPDC090106 TaxID=3365946 RepID=UPI0037F73CA2
MQRHAAETSSVAEDTGPRQVPLTPRVIVGHSALEALLSFLLLFGAISVTRWVMGTSPISSRVAEVQWRLVIIGLSVGLIVSLLILSRPGRISGGHMNPAISLAMWRFGVFPGRLLLPYFLAQFAGSVAGVAAARSAWGTAVADPPVSFGVLQPAPGWSAVGLFTVEALSTGILICAIGYFLQSPRLAPLVPWLAGLLIGVAIVLLGDVTGASMNPVRQFGPALFSGRQSLLWAYLVAPMAGAFAATSLLEARRRHSGVLTHRLCGTQENGRLVSAHREA